MSTEVIGEQDTDWLTLIDFEEDLQCSAEDCENPAEWRIIKTCLCSFNVCTKCKEMVLFYANISENSHCLICSSNVSGNFIKDVIAI